MLTSSTSFCPLNGVAEIYDAPRLGPSGVHTVWYWNQRNAAPIRDS